MIKTRLAKIEKAILPKSEGAPIILCDMFLDGTCESDGKRFNSKEEFVEVINPKNVIYFVSYSESKQELHCHKHA